MPPKTLNISNNGLNTGELESADSLQKSNNGYKTGRFLLWNAQANPIGIFAPQDSH